MSVPALDEVVIFPRKIIFQTKGVHTVPSRQSKTFKLFFSNNIYLRIQQLILTDLKKYTGSVLTSGLNVAVSR